jgi:hypothetical protein
MPATIFMKLGMYIIAPEPISTVYLKNSSHQSVCLYVYQLSLLGNGSVNVAGNGSIKTLSRHRIQIQQIRIVGRIVSYAVRVVSRKVGYQIFPELLVLVSLFIGKLNLQ